MADTLSPERALIRLEQLDREERRAVALCDVESLCRIAPLMATTVSALNREAVLRVPRGSAIVASARSGHAAAESLLVRKMEEIRRELDSHHVARRTTAGYARKRSSAARWTSEG